MSIGQRYTGGVDVQLSNNARAIIEKLVAVGAYPSAAAVIETALLRMEDDEPAYWEHMRALVAEGMEDVRAGRVSPLTAETAESIKREGRQQRARA